MLPRESGLQSLAEHARHSAIASQPRREVSVDESGELHAACVPVRDAQPSDIAVAVTLTGQREPADERFVMGSAVP